MTERSEVWGFWDEPYLPPFCSRELVRSELAQVILRHHLSGHTVLQSFFIETMIQPIASARTRAVPSVPTWLLRV